ncbi:glycosyltransferase family 39 protein [Candidatus Pelagibacter communis]|uniref:glycosyltransferase family 39 protein n=1 Tax=Pelagibacter ubique TaxID=198252 RepID=UPI00094D49BF|nr:glycosyltransferase family 39 protein [Candidatus Pelagibacter ubique]
MKKFYSKNNYIYILLFFISLIGLFTYKHYGIGIEEHFHRKSGFYWLNYILSLGEFENLKKVVDLKLDEIKTFTPRLFPIEKFGYYGVLFDLPLAFVETFFHINEPKKYFLLRHISIFFFFLTSAYCFYKIIELRYKNTFLALFGFLIYIFSPRIYGNIFFDNKDIFYLSMITINMFFYFKYLKKDNNLNLIFFSIFCAFSTSSRIIGLLIPISFIFLIFFEFLSNKSKKEILKKIFIFLITYLIALFVHWPYLWTLDLSQIINFFDPFFSVMNPIVYFNGEFYQSKYLPASYLPIWIAISTPVYIFLFFLIGYFKHFKRVFNRFININEKNSNFFTDMWSSKNENFDLFLFINFLLVIITYFALNPALLSGWRHFYFLNFFIVYYACYCVNNIFLNFRKTKYKIIFIIILFIMSCSTVYDIYKYHPFQSVYFNNLISNKMKKNFEVDTQSLSRVHAVQELLKEDGILNIATASWTPLEDARSLISKNDWNRLNFVGTEFDKADFIYSNFYYEVNTTYNEKYKIPKNFSIYKTLIIDGTRIYSIYKKI